MRFVFTCPHHNKNFESDAFRMTDNRGVKTDKEGRKYLDAKVVLSTPCPHCGETHSFCAEELACPFNSKNQGA